MNIVKIDKDGFYISHRVGNNFDTWGQNELRNVQLPLLTESKVYQYVNSSWVEHASDPRILQNLVIAVTETTQQRLDDFAKTRNYDGILSACTYATSSIPKFASEGQYAVSARDATWATLYTILGEVEASTRTAPTGFADIEAELPALVWPAQ